MTARYGSNNLAQGYAAIIGVVLVAVGILGFIPNPIVGEPAAGGAGEPIFVTGMVHNIVHLATGALALFIAFGLRGRDQANGVIGLGILYAIIFVALLIDGDLFGILQYQVNAADHVLHAALAVVSIAVGYMARGSEAGTVVAR